MTRLSKVLIAAAALIAVPVQSAMAQDTPPEGEGEAAPPPEDASGTPADPNAPAAALGGATGSWSQRFKDRPINILKGMIRVDVGTGVGKVFTPGSAGPPVIPSSSGTVIPLSVGAGYGISDKLEAGISYGLTLKPFEAQGSLRLYGLFQLKHSEKLRVSAGASFGFASIPDGPGLAAGLSLQYHLNDKMWVYMPPTHVSLGLDPVTFAINLPVGFGFQVNEKIYAFGETNLFNIGIEPSGSSFIFADSTPLTIGGFFSPSNKMDIGAAFAMPNVPDVADAFTIAVVARLYFGSVPGSAGAAAAAVTDPASDATPPAM